MPEFSDWSIILKEAGPYGVMLLITLIALWKTMRWAAANIVQPLVKSHLDLIETLGTSIVGLREVQAEQTKLLQAKMELLREIHGATVGRKL